MSGYSRDLTFAKAQELLNQSIYLQYARFRLFTHTVKGQITRVIPRGFILNTDEREIFIPFQSVRWYHPIKSQEDILQDKRRMVMRKLEETSEKLKSHGYQVLGIDVEREVVIYDDHGSIHLVRRYPSQALCTIHYSNGDLDPNEIYIQDIWSNTHENEGYGSLAMNHLISLARARKYKRIYGKIVQTDWEHVERLKHFYEKFGFEVELNLEKKKGKISLLLTE
ncbi:GNAT family N-acetyltransferase [Alicyclobacillus suci]|uniref:GNAT family N-acetyltransferase n=1 Tax=Alicyclobacillus suci TaxID=2816080 RepID=UPI001A8ED40E|nr:GNAT family N-acetyltransferase [Alicyclobacillus suci]